MINLKARLMWKDRQVSVYDGLSNSIMYIGMGRSNELTALKTRTSSHCPCERPVPHYLGQKGLDDFADLDHIDRLILEPLPCCLPRQTVAPSL